MCFELFRCTLVYKFGKQIYIYTIAKERHRLVMDFLRSYHSSVQFFTQQVGNVGGQEAGNHWWLAFGDPTCQTEKREFDVLFLGR